MVVIRGRVQSARSNGYGRGLGALLGRGRWILEYTVRDTDGSPIDQGVFKAHLDGRFALALEAPSPRVVEIRIRSRKGRSSDWCKVSVFSNNDIINLPRRLSPN